MVCNGYKGGELHIRGGCGIRISNKLYHKLTAGQFENAKVKVKNAKLWNPDFVGMVIFIMVLFYIIIYHIMVYIGSW